MSKTGPIILVEDDPDDHNIFEEALTDIRVANKLRWFINPIEAFSYLISTEEQPFLIFCDINLPKQNGLDFKKRIDEDKYLRQKSIPFIFYSTAANQETINQAYLELTVQGFFQKKHKYDDIKKMLRLIIDYWSVCKHPNSG